MTDKDELVFSTIQTFLKNPPVIIWGSGATVALGLPTMGTLNTALRKNITGFNESNDNLEIELGDPKYEPQFPEIRKVIWDAVNTADAQVLSELINNNCRLYDGINRMIEKFRETHPQVVNIITTNYDRVLEYVMAYHNIPFTDGFEGKQLSRFYSDSFRDKNITNLIKVHGSLNWFKVDGSIRHLMQNSETVEPVIICPGKNKYKEAYNSPYRELIQKADDLINEASSFLVVGFGFNDAHLTPKIREKVREGTPLVSIAKEITDSCKEELKDAQKYIFLQEGDDSSTKVTLKLNRDSEPKEIIVKDDFWKLDQFMEIL